MTEVQCPRCLGKGKIYYGPETIGGQKETNCDEEVHRYVRVGPNYVKLERLKAPDGVAGIIGAALAIGGIVAAILLLALGRA